jgi:hypothetical protein
MLAIFCQDETPHVEIKRVVFRTAGDSVDLRFPQMGRCGPVYSVFPKVVLEEAAESLVGAGLGKVTVLRRQVAEHIVVGFLRLARC